MKSAKNSLFVVILLYVKPLEEIDRQMKAHVAFLRRRYASKHFIASGRQVPRTGGVILARAKDRAELEAIMEEDPFVSSGAANFAVVEFTPSMHAPEFEPFL